MSTTTTTSSSSSHNKIQKLISTTIPWTSGNWTVSQPKSFSIVSENNSLQVEANENSDFWQNTCYGFQHDNGHFLNLIPRFEPNTAMETTFQLDHFTHQFDQAGLMIRLDANHWIKCGIELSDGILQLGAVVTHNGQSDWSVGPANDWNGKLITIRMSRDNRDSITIRAKASNSSSSKDTAVETPWRLVRVAFFPHQAIPQGGIFLCAPTRSGFKVVFTKFEITPADKSLHDE
jgi:regulation of enolase protein 1 (concanavalin A-like superfamily)